MDEPTLDARLPLLYRRILDAATELERRGLRAEALHLRRRAAGEYRKWDDRAERRMNGLLDSVVRRLQPAGGSDGLGRRLRARLRTAPGANAVAPSARPEPSA